MNCLEKELSDLPESFMILIVSPAEEIIKTNMEVLKTITASGGFGMYITLNHPYKTLTNLLEKNGIDTKRFFFIDCITKTVDSKPERIENCLFTASPSSLTELGIAFGQAIEAMPEGKKFIFMDTLSTLLIYNSAGTTAKFAHFLIARIRLLGLNGIFMAVEDESDRRVLAQVEQFCDKCIHINHTR